MKSFERKTASAIVAASLAISFIYVLVSGIVNRSFFRSIKAGSGSEVMAYGFYGTGTNLAEDRISRWLCIIYSYGFAVLFLTALLVWIAFLCIRFMKESRLRLWIVIHLVLVAAWCAYLFFIYPSPINNSPDTFYNYVYAREWLPMYWHGFLTNVFYCASFLIIPHPLGMMLLPGLFGLNILGYGLYRFFICRFRYGWIPALLLLLSIFLFPPFTEIFGFVGRNFMYATLAFGLFVLIGSDNLIGREMSFMRLVAILFLGSMVVTWRGEGMLWIILLPLTLILVYRNSFKGKKNVLSAICVFLIFFLVMWLPGKYGASKYQGKDYLMINTVRSLGAVFNSDDANLFYKGADEDIEALNRVIPTDYIRSFGAAGFTYWNSYNLRSQRQCDAGVYGDAYVKAAYRVLLHNPVIWIRERIDLYCRTFGLPDIAKIPAPSYDLEVRNSEEADALLVNWWADYYAKGRDDIEQVHAISLGAGLRARLTQAYLEFVGSSFGYFGYEVIFLLAFTVVLAVGALIKKNMLYFSVGFATLCCEGAIFLAAPDAFPNYYFYCSFVQFWLLWLFVTDIFAKRSPIKKGI